MTPSQVFMDKIPPLVAADTTGLAELTPFVMVSLVASPFVPSLDLDITTLTLASFTGATPKHAADAGPHVFLDPATNEWMVQVDPPAGGWHWQTTATTNLPETIYGWICTDSAGVVLQGSDVFPEPIVLQIIGQGVDIPRVAFRFQDGYVS